LLRDPRRLDGILHPSQQVPRNQLGNKKALSAGRQRVSVDVLDLAVVRGDARQQCRELRDYFRATLP
jgi:hypothetical protein